MILVLAGCGSPSEPTPSNAAAQTAEQIAAQDLERNWELVTGEFPNAERPPTTRLRFIDLSESADVYADCMVDSGFPGVRATSDGGVESGDIPAGQAEAYAIAFYVCRATYPIDPKFTTPLKDDQKAMLYAYFRDELAPCLTEHGFDVPDAPSEQTFIESYDETGGWDVYANVAAKVDEQGWYEINSACPQLPDALFD